MIVERIYILLDFLTVMLLIILLFYGDIRLKIAICFFLVCIFINILMIFFDFSHVLGYLGLGIVNIILLFIHLWHHLND